MCVRTFLNESRRPGEPVVEPSATQVAGARALGAAFQKINFLRDLAVDNGELERTYFPDTAPGDLSAEQLDAILVEINRDVAVARGALPELPSRARYAVAATLALYQRLLDDIALCTPQEILERRVRLSTPTKLMVVGEAVLSQVRAAR